MARGTEFPKFLYHKIRGEKIVKSQEEQEELGDGWGETPFAPSPAQAQETVGGAEGLTARVEALEKMFDKLRARKDIDKLLANQEED